MDETKVARCFRCHASPLSAQEIQNGWLCQACSVGAAEQMLACLEILANAGGTVFRDADADLKIDGNGDLVTAVLASVDRALAEEPPGSIKAIACRALTGMSLDEFQRASAQLGAEQPRPSVTLQTTGTVSGTLAPVPMARKVIRCENVWAATPAARIVEAPIVRYGDANDSGSDERSMQWPSLAEEAASRARDVKVAPGPAWVPGGSYVVGDVVSTPTGKLQCAATGAAPAQPCAACGSASTGSAVEDPAHWSTAQWRPWCGSAECRDRIRSARGMDVAKTPPVPVFGTLATLPVHVLYPETKPYLMNLRNLSASDTARLDAIQWLRLNGYESIDTVKAECDRVFDEIQLARLARADALPIGKAPQCGHQAITHGCSTCAILRDRLTRLGIERAARIMMAEAGAPGPSDTDELRKQFGLPERDAEEGYVPTVGIAGFRSPPPRPDGFSQSAVDAAKAVLLAPVSKKGGR